MALGHKGVQWWNLPDGWVISARPAHPALVTEADFIAAQAVNAARGPVPRGGPAAVACQRRLYLLHRRFRPCGSRISAQYCLSSGIARFSSSPSHLHLEGITAADLAEALAGRQAAEAIGPRKAPLHLINQDQYQVIERNK